MLWLALTLSFLGLPATATADSFAPVASSEASSLAIATSTVYNVAAAADNGGKQVIKVACFVPLEIPFGQAIYRAFLSPSPVFAFLSPSSFRPCPRVAVRLAEAQVNGNDQLLPDYRIEVVPVNTSLSTTQAAAAGTTLSPAPPVHASVVESLSHPPCSGADNAGREGGRSSEPSLSHPPSSPPTFPHWHSSTPPAVVQTMLAERVVAAVGPTTSSQAHVLSAIHTQVQLAERVVAAVGPMTSSQALVLSAIHTQVQAGACLDYWVEPTLMSHNAACLLAPSPLRPPSATDPSLSAAPIFVPMVSYSATDPSLSAASYPFFTRTIRSDALEMQAIAGE
ncbi:unnamed protein product [Closterium sp. NIES-65]|nr:unnamed protein product [Closterium sp. NIES-65]